MDLDSRPLNTKLRKGRWFWEPSAKQRKLLNIKGRALGAEQVSAWAMARKLNNEMLELSAGGKQAGTVGWVFQQFFKSDRFLGNGDVKGLAKSTQTDYRWLAERLGKVKVGDRQLGQVIASAVRARHADLIISQIERESGHSTAHYCARFARRVWNWAGRQEYVTRVDNPWAGMELRGLPERDALWQPHQVAAVIAKAVEMDRMSIANAVRIAYSFGHRKSDILPLTWTAWDSGMRRTSKTGVMLPAVPSAYPDMQTAIEAERARQKASDTPSTHIIVCELTGGPWHPDVFAHHFRMVANAANIPSELQFRDLRATASTELSDAGADIIDLSTHTGHKDMKMARRYSRRTQDQFQRAAAKRQAGKAKVENESPSPSGAKETTK